MNFLDFVKINSHIINEQFDTENFIKKARISLNNKGYYLAKNFLKEEIYAICRKESISYFNKKTSHKRLLRASLRGDIAAGMKDVLGFTKNKTWHLYRNCSFNWNSANEEIKNILNTSRCISKVRNLLNGKSINYGDAIEKEGYITYTSLSLYPSGGGFLKEHHDGLEYSSDSNKQGKILHFKIELTHYGKDYSEGGFCIKDKETKEMVNLSKISSPTDVIFFDGSQKHVVRKIYGGKLGRIAFFQIPTFVSNESRTGIYSGDGWSKPKTIFLIFSNKFIYLLKKLINKVIDYLV